MAGEDWSDTENDLTAAAYFMMLLSELRHENYVKSAVRNALVRNLNGRSPKSVEYKFQNVSAVLLLLGEPWIDGFKPASRFQHSLIDAVLRWLNANPHWLAEIRDATHAKLPRLLAEASNLWIGPPPTHSNAPSPIDPGLVALVARKFDVASRDANNRALGLAGEELILNHERQTLRASGKSALAERVNWTAQNDGDGAGYDIASFELDGSPKLIEVKTTNGWDRTPFHITRTELKAADVNRACWHLVRVWNFAKGPKAFALRPPLEAHVNLTPTSFLASLH